MQTTDRGESVIHRSATAPSGRTRGTSAGVLTFIIYGGA